MSFIDNLYRVQKKDIKKAANVLADAFFKDPLWDAVFKENQLSGVISEVMLKFCLRYGNVFASSDNLEGGNGHCAT